jgi:hypothetical protein
LLFCSGQVSCGWCSLLQSLQLFFWTGLDSCSNNKSHFL